MIHHSISHGTVSLISLVGAQMLSNKVEAYFPTIHNWIANFSDWFIDSFDLSIRQNQLENALIVLALGLIWGIVFWHLSARNAWR